MTKAGAPIIAAQNISHKYSISGAKTCAFPAGLPTDRGETTYTIGSIVNTDGVLSANPAVDAAAGTVSYTLTGTSQATKTASFRVTAAMKNYEDAAVNYTITLTDKDVPSVTANNITVTYTGSAVPASAITGTASFGDAAVAGAWSWKTAAPTTVAQSGTYTVVFTPADGTNYAAVEKSITVTIAKATLTGTPTFTAVTVAGKKLNDITLVKPSAWPDGSFHWKDADTTEIKANVAYAYTFTATTPNDANYNVYSGSAVLYPVYVAPSTFTLTFSTNGGSAVAAVSKTSGTTVDLSAYKPTRSGYTFAGWCSDEALTTAVTSVKLTANTTVYAKWTMVNPFIDVHEGDYFFDAVLWAAAKGVTNGTTPTTFAPFMNCTRAQVMTFLWRAMGSPKAAATVNPFTDVKPDAYYYDAVLWAVEQGITKGTGDTAFSPDAAVTRAQFVTLLWRLAGKHAPAGANPFTDVKTGTYYYDAVVWAEEKEITTGATTTTFNPNGVCDRGQIMAFLYRYFGK